MLVRISFLVVAVGLVQKLRPRKPRVLGIIPARYASTRFPAKPLALLGGKPMIEHTYFNSLKAGCLDELVVATDDRRIERAVRSFGGKAVLTSPTCQNGTERCLEVLNALRQKGHTFDIVVNIQGDEPLIEAEHIEEVVRVLAQSTAVMGTLARPGKGASPPRLRMV
eukprot:scaffold3134_cov414-Prasinococcus_capsulatus_cf.AAC.16